MHAHQNKYVLPLLSSMAAVILLATILANHKISSAIIDHAVNLSQIQTRQAKAKLEAFKLVMGKKPGQTIPYQRSEKIVPLHF